jgi:bifunctional DNase/RNase
MNSDDIFQYSRARFDHAAARRVLREKYEAKLTFAHNGGLFRVTPELLAFVKTWPIDELYLADLYQNPILIDRQVFLVQIQQHYQEQMNAWHQEFEALNQQR